MGRVGTRSNPRSPAGGGRYRFGRRVADRPLVPLASLSDCIVDIARDTAGQGGAAPPATSGPASDSQPASPARAEGGFRPHSNAFDGQRRPRSTTRPQPPPTRPSLSQFINEIRAAFSARFHLFELEAK